MQLMPKGDIAIPKVWRSEIKGVVIFLFLTGAALFLSNKFPLSVLRGELFRYGDTLVYLRLPLFWLLPAFVLGGLLVRMYDVSHVMSAAGLESRTGIVSVRQVVTKVRYEDIRGVEVVQSVLDRLFDVGILEVSTSATGGVEIIMEGIAHPREVQETILAERDRRQIVSARSQDDAYLGKHRTGDRNTGSGG